MTTRDEPPRTTLGDVDALRLSEFTVIIGMRIENLATRPEGDN